MILHRTNDYFFKRVFGSEEGKEALVGLLNATQKRSSHDLIQSVVQEDREIDPERIYDKAVRLDVLAHTELGHIFNVEVQVARQFFLDKRILYYWAALYHRQLQQGKPFGQLLPTVSISILGFKYFSEDERYHHMFHICDDETGKLLNRDLELHVLELTKIKNISRKPQNTLEEWLAYLNGIQGEGLEALAMSNPAIRKALTIEEMFKADARERRLYEMREKAFLDEISNVAGAKEEGKAEGKADAICQYLEARFGSESQFLQETVRAIADLDVLNRIISRIFNVNQLEEAKALIQGSLVSQ
ncbi:PD-(D/E)XK nuclease family transposase [Peptococcaceae bacterium CEB3]|nr:PD-(D/E)XK nuclease family transposase [Peptococcaceae bacterium CEB3]